MASLSEVCRAASRAGRSEDSSPEMCELRSFIRASRVGRNSEDEAERFWNFLRASLTCDF